MKKIMTKIISIVAMVSMVISLAAVPAFASNPTYVTEKSLNTFDAEVWKEYPSTTDKVYTIPSSIPSMQVNGNGNHATIEKVNGIFGKDSEDVSIRLNSSNNNDFRNQREFSINVLDLGTATNGAKEDRFTVYLELAADSIPAGVGSGGYYGVQLEGASVLSAPFYFHNDGSGNYSIVFRKNDLTTSSEAPYTLGTWVRIALDIYMYGNGTVNVTTWYNGEDTSRGAIERNIGGLKNIKVGYQWPQMTEYPKPSMYVDNVAISYEGFNKNINKNRWKAIADASDVLKTMKSGNASLSKITSNLNLATQGSNGSTIEWSKSGDVGAVDTITGAVTRDLQEDKHVTLTAKVTNGAAAETATESVSYDITVPKLDVTFDEIKGSNQYEGSIISNLTLPSAISGGGPEIVWESSNPSVIATDGKVHRNVDESYRVTMTAKLKSDGTVVKVFDLYVPGDYMVNDSCVDLTKVNDSENLRIAEDSYLRVKGFSVVDKNANGYAIYDAAPGCTLSVEIKSNASGGRGAEVYYSADKVNWTRFTEVTSNQKGDLIEFAGEVGGYWKTYTESTSPLPEGTRYVKIGGLFNAYNITGVKIIHNSANDVTFETIKGENTSKDLVVSNLDLSSLTDVSSTAPEIIAADGTVTRPEKDTQVSITGTINNSGISAVKTFNVIVKGTEELPISELPWLIYKKDDLYKKITQSTLETGGEIIYAADLMYMGAEPTDAIGFVAVYSSDGELLEIQTVEKSLEASVEPQRAQTILTLEKETEQYKGASVKGFIFQKGKLIPLGVNNGYIAK